MNERRNFSTFKIINTTKGTRTGKINPSLDEHNKYRQGVIRKPEYFNLDYRISARLKNPVKF